MEIYDKRYKMPKGRLPGRGSNLVDAKIHEIYLLNQERLDAAWTKREKESAEYRKKMKQVRLNQISSETLFTNSVKDVLATNDISLSDAIKTVFNQDYYTGAEIRGRRNIMAAIKSDPEFYNQFRRLTGWNKAIDLNQFQWDKANNMWIYAGLIGVSAENSPKRGNSNGLSLIPVPKD